MLSLAAILGAKANSFFVSFCFVLSFYFLLFISHRFFSARQDVYRQIIDGLLSVGRHSNCAETDEEGRTHMAQLSYSTRAGRLAQLGR